MDERKGEAFDTREFQFPTKKGSRQALRGLVCFLFVCVMLAATAVGVLGGAYFYTENQSEALAAPAALQPGTTQPSPGFSLGAAEAAVLPLCVAAGEKVALGTGVVITEDGYLLTCDHLFAGMKSPRVCATLSDGSVTDCAYVGGDDRLDVAVLKMEKRQMACLPIDPSVRFSVGQRVAALGCPEAATRPLVTAGVLSSTGVRVATDGDYPLRRLQTDAPIRPGYSGGALVNEEGAFLGLIQAKEVASDTEGVAYALGIETLCEVIDELIQNGALARRVSLGVTVDYRSPVVAAATGRPAGLRIAALSTQSPLAAQGFAVDDVIRAVNGQPITGLDDFFDPLEMAQEGDVILLTIARADGGERQVSLPLSWEKGSSSYRS